MFSSSKRSLHSSLLIKKIILYHRALKITDFFNRLLSSLMFIYYVSNTIIIKRVNIILSGNYDTLLNFDAFAGISSYKYGFTDSEFLAFIADLDPTEYILVITVVTILININLNIFEQYVVSGALLDIAVTSQNMVQQRGFQLARQGEAVSQ